MGRGIGKGNDENVKGNVLMEKENGKEGRERYVREEGN